MRCDGCGHWCLERRTIYGDGSEVVTYAAPAGKGRCAVLDTDTSPEFGCVSFFPGDHVRVTRKDGAPWRHWRVGDCPDCGGRGSSVEAGVCGRCVGTGKVRHYEDGHVGEERTRLHPKEKETACTTTAEVPGTTLRSATSPREGLI